MEIKKIKLEDVMAKALVNILKFLPYLLVLIVLNGLFIPVLSREVTRVNTIDLVVLGVILLVNLYVFMALTEKIFDHYKTTDMSFISSFKYAIKKFLKTTVRLLPLTLLVTFVGFILFLLSFVVSSSDNFQTMALYVVGQFVIVFLVFNLPVLIIMNKRLGVAMEVTKDIMAKNKLLLLGLIVFKIILGIILDFLGFYVVSNSLLYFLTTALQASVNLFFYYLVVILFIEAGQLHEL